MHSPGHNTLISGAAQCNRQSSTTTALADEAADALQLLSALERAWFAGRHTVAGRRRHSRAPAAVDLLAAAPLLSATSLAASLGMAVTNATALLDRFCADGIAVEATHRSKRRLFGLAGLAPLRGGVALPRRPQPGRGRGRPRLLPVEDAAPPLPLPPVASLPPLERRTFDTSELEGAMAFADATIRTVRRNLEALFGPGPSTVQPRHPSGTEGEAERAPAPDLSAPS